jgi:O-antigen ligase
VSLGAEFLPPTDRSRSWPWLALLGVGWLALVVTVVEPRFAPGLAGVAIAGIVAITSRRDEVSAIGLVLATTFLLPANLIIGPLGQVGVPSLLAAVLLLLVWSYGRLVPTVGLDRGRNPIRTFATVLLVTTLASYVAGQLRGLNTAEASSMDASILALLAVLGLILFPADTLRDEEAVRRVVVRIVGGAAFMAVVGVFQFYGIIDLAELIRLPGLVVHTSTADFIQARSGFNRVAGLATHPIEFGVMLSMCLPLSLHLALHTKGPARQGMWLMFGLIAFGIPLSISRSAVLATGVGMMVYLLTVRLSVFRWLLPLAAVGVGAVAAAAPGLIGSIISLFTGADNDPSIQHRTDSYDLVLSFWKQYPVFGIGPGTYLPQYYRVLDNQYLYDVVTVGTVGVLVTVALFATGYSLARRARWASSNPASRSLAQALAASIAAAAVAAFTFDAFGFKVMFTLAHLLVGCAAALWRIRARDGGRPLPGALPRHLPTAPLTLHP